MERSEKPRRLAVVLDGPPTPAWQVRALEELASSPLLDVGGRRLAGPVRRSRAALAVEAVERRLFALGGPALAPEAVDPAAGGGEELTVWLAEGSPPDAPGPLLRLRHGGREEGAERAFRRAALRGEPVVETEVVAQDGAGTRVVARTFSAARPFSTTLSRDRALWKIAGLVRRAAERGPGLDEPARAAEGGAAPSAAELLARAPARWLRIAGARALYERRWQIRVREAGADPASGWERSGLPVRWRRGHLYADPMLIEHEGRHHLFCEDLPPGAWRAVISHTVLGEEPVGRVPEVVLEAPHHLSYPFVFEHEGELFMIPETSSQRRVELYRAVSFPHRWELETVLLEDLAASDATVLAHEGALWMFVGVAAPHATMLDETHLFSASSPRGPWRAHPANPIVSDVRCGRPGGAVQRRDGRLLRPAQDGSRRYGGAVSFREIEVLSAEDYAEREVARIDPAAIGGSARATHTYAADSAFEAIDLRERRLRLRTALTARLGREA